MRYMWYELLCGVGLVELSDVEAVGAWQSGMAYKGFGPNVTSLTGIDTAKVSCVDLHLYMRMGTISCLRKWCA